MVWAKKPGLTLSPEERWSLLGDRGHYDGTRDAADFTSAGNVFGGVTRMKHHTCPSCMPEKLRSSGERGPNCKGAKLSPDSGPMSMAHFALSHSNTSHTVIVCTSCTSLRSKVKRLPCDLPPSRHMPVGNSVHKLQDCIRARRADLSPSLGIFKCSPAGPGVRSRGEGVPKPASVCTREHWWEMAQ
jgi:hypothetical protein